jgi:pyruvate dehydrogenase E1 component beta subunit
MSGGGLQLPLVIRAVIGRGWGQGAQHSKSLHGMFGHFPGIKVALPTSPQDAYSMLRAAIRDNNPVILLEHRWLYDIEGAVDEHYLPPLTGPVVVRHGSAVTVACTSWMTIEAMKAAEVLTRHGIELDIIDMRTVAPLDESEVVASIERTGHCIVADYDWLYAGFSAELAARLAHRCFSTLRKPVERIGFAPVPCPTTRPLENLFYPSAVHIIRTVERMLDLPELDLQGESFYSYEERFKGPF